MDRPVHQLATISCEIIDRSLMCNQKRDSNLTYQQNKCATCTVPVITKRSGVFEDQETKLDALNKIWSDSVGSAKIFPDWSAVFTIGRYSDRCSEDGKWNVALCPSSGEASYTLSFKCRPNALYTVNSVVLCQLQTDFRNRSLEIRNTVL